MEFLKIITGFSFITYLFLGLFILFQDYKSKVHRNFFYFCLFFSLWTLCNFISYLYLDNINLKIFWIDTSYALGSPFNFFLLKFFLILTGFYNNKKIKIIFYSFSWIIPVIIIYKSITSDDIALSSPNGFWYLSYESLFCTYNMITCFLVFIWGRVTKLKREKKESNILFVTGFLTIVSAWVIDYIAGLFKIPTLSSIIGMLWFIALIFIISKYRFMRLTPELVSNDIISNIDESLILLDKDFNIITENKSTETLLNYSKNVIRSIGLSKIILEYNMLIIEINNLIHGIHKDFSTRINYINKDGIQIFMDTKISIIKDKFDDMIGILIIGKEVKELKQFKSIYKITDRQAEVVQDIICGKTNKEIAEKMNIAERTVKGHITGIYDKLGIDNKIQLFNLLKVFNLIPESMAEKTVILLKKK